MIVLTGSRSSNESLAHRCAIRRQFDGIVVLSPFYWNFNDDMWQTTHHVASEFSRVLPTLYVEPFVQWNAFSEQFRSGHLWQSVAGSRTRSPLADLTVFHRRGLPFGRFAPVRRLGIAHNASALGKAMKRLGISRPLLWHSFPMMSEPLIDVVSPSLFAYHCLDHSRAEEEPRLIRKADLVFCVSDSLVARHGASNPRTYLMPNGVDTHLFDPDRVRHTPRPADLPQSGRILGFLGALNFHLDMELLVSVAQRFANDTVVLIGRVMGSDTAMYGEQRQAFERLRRLPNVRILGFKPTCDLPAYLHHFDVCLIPFLDNAFNSRCDPLKFYQYAAMGKPVVSRPISLAARYPRHLYVGASPAEFCDRIDQALNDSTSPAVRDRMLELAREHSWERIVSQACGTLAGLAGLQGKRA
jgi:glycosyltransferase involved in cell wall biosynthesis